MWLTTDNWNCGFQYFSMYLLWKKFNLKWNQSVWDRKFYTFAFRKMKLRNWETDFPEMFDLQKTETYLLTNWISTKNLSPLSSWWMYCLDSVCLDLPHFAFLAHKYSPPQALNRLACTLLQHAFPILKFFCYFWINSVSGNLSLP